MPHPYEKLFSPIQVGKVLLPNRAVMAPMATNLATPDGMVSDPLIEYYVERARNDVGMIIIECSCIDSPAGKNVQNEIAVDRDECIPGLKRLASSIQKAGAKAALQIHHAGSLAKSLITGKQPISCSAVPSRVTGETPLELSLPEIGDLVEKFAQAVRRARDAGMDGVDLHFSHGYLVTQFLSPLTNLRSDVYGGSMENRLRFALEIIRRSRERVGNDYLIMAKVTVDQFIPGGLTLKETGPMVQRMAEAGLDMIHATAGDPNSLQALPVPPMSVPRGCYVNLAEDLRKYTTIPIAAVGRINDPEVAEKILRDGRADVVDIGRGLLADAALLRKAREGRPEEMRRCIGCNQGCRWRDRTKYLAIRCAVNPEVGREKKVGALRANARRKVLIVGGGPGGMEAARVAALRGHDVTLCEKTGSLGGQLILAARPPGREEISNLTRYLTHELERLKVRVYLKREIDATAITEMAPDAVIVATGSIPVKLDGANSLPCAEEVLGGRMIPGRRVVIVGGGSVGSGTADYLSEKGHQVTLVLRRSDFGLKLEPSTKLVVQNRLREKGVTVVTKGRFLGYGGGHVRIEREGAEETIPADDVVLAVGYRPDNLLYQQIQAGGKVRAYAIGDCVEPRGIMEAVNEGAEAAWSI